MSCKRSIKANHYLNEAQARVLLKDLARCENPFNCPMAVQYWFTLPIRIWKGCSNESRPALSQREEENMKIVLASQSPRRKELLAHIVSEFEIEPADIDETPFQTNSPSIMFVEWLKKSTNCLGTRWKEDHLVIASDTTVVLNQEIMGKPEDLAEAEFMLKN